MTTKNVNFGICLIIANYIGIVAFNTTLSHMASFPDIMLP